MILNLDYLAEKHAIYLYVENMLFSYIIDTEYCYHCKSMH